MARIDCPFNDCTYSTPEGAEATVIVALMSLHSIVYRDAKDKMKPEKGTHGTPPLRQHIQDMVKEQIPESNRPDGRDTH